MTDENRIEAARDAIWRTAADPASWEEAIRAVMRALDAPCAHYAVVDLEAGVAVKGLWTDYDGLEEMLEHGDRVVNDDPWMRDGIAAMRSASRRGARRVLLQGARRVDPRSFRESPFFNDIARTTDVSDYVSSVSIIDRRYAALLAANLTKEGRIFSEAQVRTLDALSPDLDRAFRVAHRISQTAAAPGPPWDDCRLPVFVLRERRIEHANPPASELRERGGVVEERLGVARFVDPRTEEALAAVERGDERSVALVSTASTGERWLLQMIRQKPRESLFAPLTSPSVLLIATPLSEGAVGRTEAVSGFSSLSEAERTVLDALVRGRSVESIAILSDRSIDTVRWHVRNMIQKTGAASLADLIRIGTLLAPF